MPRHLLDRGQVNAGVEQVTGPGPAQIVGCEGLDTRFAARSWQITPGR
jgi:hypothetical protein